MYGGWLMVCGVYLVFWFRKCMSFYSKELLKQVLSRGFYLLLLFISYHFDSTYRSYMADVGVLVEENSCHPNDNVLMIFNVSNLLSNWIIFRAVMRNLVLDRIVFSPHRSRAAASLFAAILIPFRTTGKFFLFIFSNLFWMRVVCYCILYVALQRRMFRVAG